MKITSLHEAVRSLPQVREKRDGEGFQRHQPERDGRNNKEEHENDANAAPIDDQIGEAVQAFQSDEQARANGLNASLLGKGPGLRVVLRDGSGAFIRQFTGEEFLKLREAVGPKAGAGRGKILDQKL